jgi:D-alanine-D-alanine ligase
VKLRVAVIYGGRSGEHEVSVRSAQSVMEAMDPARYEVLRFFIDKDGKWDPHPIQPEPGSNPGIDVVFPVLHGTFGEDGAMQGLLEMAELPYVGAGILGSSLAMDKDALKRVCRERGLPVVEHVVVLRSCIDLDAICRQVSFPVFVKPANLGSSVGISKARNREELRGALELAAQYDRKIIVERAIDGRELECSVLGNDDPVASRPCEVLPSREFYDYEDKYLCDSAQFKLPAELTSAETAEVRRLAVECYRAAECEGMARVDFFLEKGTGQIYINEINTIPGFTSISMFPRMWAGEGMAYPTLVDRLIQLALERHEARKATRYSR